MNTQARPSLLPQMARLFAAQVRVYCLSVGIAGLLGIASLTVVALFMARGAEKVGFDPVMTWKSITFTQQLAVVFGLQFALWTPILLAARGISRITTDQLSGQPISLNKILMDMIGFVPAALVYSPIIGFATMITSSIFFVPGIVVASLFVLVVPTTVNESAGIFAALRRGISLSPKVFGKALMLTLACAALVVLIVILRINRFLPDTRVFFALRFTLSYIPALLLLVLSNICFTLLYYEARAREAPPTLPGIPRLQR